MRPRSGLGAANGSQAADSASNAVRAMPSRRLVSRPGTDARQQSSGHAFTRYGHKYDLAAASLAGASAECWSRACRALVRSASRRTSKRPASISCNETMHAFGHWSAATGGTIGHWADQRASMTLPGIEPPQAAAFTKIQADPTVGVTGAELRLPAHWIGRAGLSAAADQQPSCLDRPGSVTRPIRRLTRQPLCLAVIIPFGSLMGRVPGSGVADGLWPRSPARSV